LPKETANTKTTDYVVASFITNCAKDHPGLFENIKVLVQSHILANALMCPDLEKTSKGFKDVHFLADTRFLLKALDLESKYDTDNARQLISAIRTLKGSVCVFTETKDELRTVLKAIIKGMQQGAGRGPVCRELLKRGRGVADVILADSNLDRSLASLAISILPSPRYEEGNFQFQIDETELRQEIESEVDYITDQAAEHDIRVVRHIFALRKGRKVSTIEDSGFVLLTTNSALSRAAFHYEKNNSTGFFFSAVVTDYHLSHLAWLKSPMEVPDLPRAEILASCYATMRPHESFWNRYLTEIDRLKSEKKMSQQDHEVLRFSLNAPDELMEVTRGDVEGITDKNLHIVLEKLEKTYATEKEIALQRERTEHEKTKAALLASELSTQTTLREKTAVELRQAALEEDKANREAEIQKLKQIESEATAKEKRTRTRIDRIAGGIAKAAFCLTGVLFAVISVLAFFGNIRQWYGIPAAIVGFFNLWVGFSGNSVESVVKRWIAKRLTGFMS
jgi:hypothetical protein